MRLEAVYKVKLKLKQSKATILLMTKVKKVKSGGPLVLVFILLIFTSCPVLHLLSVVDQMLISCFQSPHHFLCMVGFQLFLYGIISC